MATLVLRGELTTDATVDTVARLLGEAWQKNKVRAKIGDIEEPEPGRYRMSMMGNVLDVSVVSDGSGSRVRARVVKTMTSQDKLLIFIPLGPKRVHANDLMKRLLGKQLADGLRTSGFSATFSAEKVPL